MKKKNFSRKESRGNDFKAKYLPLTGCLKNSYKGKGYIIKIFYNFYDKAKLLIESANLKKKNVDTEEPTILENLTGLERFADKNVRTCN